MNNDINICDSGLLSVTTAADVIKNIATPAFVIDSNYNVVIWNSALEELTGTKASDVINTTEYWSAFYERKRLCLVDLVICNLPFDHAAKMYKHIRSSPLANDAIYAEAELTIGGSKRNFAITAAPIRHNNRVIFAIETFVDITEQVALSNKLLQAQKLESIGLLAGGIAHDFNNILTVINGYVDLLSLDSIEGKCCKVHHINGIQEAVKSAAEMIRGLLSFSNKNIEIMKCCNVSSIICGLNKNFFQLLGKNTKIDLNGIDTGHMVLAEKSQLEQVIMNLVMNARDAVENITHGIIKVETAYSKLDEDLVDNLIRIPQGEYSVIKVSDNGCGIRSEDLCNIYDPFYTTKDLGKGTGLGLSIVHNIINKLNGYITINSQLGVGTIFTVYIPSYMKISEEAKPDDQTPIKSAGGGR